MKFIVNSVPSCQFNISNEHTENALCTSWQIFQSSLKCLYHCGCRFHYLSFSLDNILWPLLFLFTRCYTSSVFHLLSLFRKSHSWYSRTVLLFSLAVYCSIQNHVLKFVRNAALSLVSFIRGVIFPDHRKEFSRHLFWMLVSNLLLKFVILSTFFNKPVNTCSMNTPPNSQSFFQ